MRKFSALLAVIVFLLTFAACGGSAKDVPLADIAAKIDEAISAEGSMSERNANYIKGMMDMDADAYEEFIVKTNAIGVSFNEYGIFRGKDKAQTDAIAKSVETYLDMLRDSWMDEYMPEEKPKIQNAEYKVTANYVIYAIMSEDDKADAFAAFDDCLK